MITLYTREGCPNCEALQNELQNAGLDFTIVTDIDLMINKGFDFLPMLEINGIAMNNGEAIKWIKEGAKV